MITLQLHSEKYNCDMQFKFDTQGQIVGFEIMAENPMNGTELSTFLALLPQSHGELLKYCKKKNLTLIELKPDLSFEIFWNKYNYKDGGSKKKAEAVWDKLSEKDKATAISWIPRYENILIRQGVAKMYATTYLNQKRWE